MTVRRYDVATISRIRKTPQGGYRIPASLTRVGVLSYKRADGTVRRELRAPDEVFKQTSLDSLQAAPVTDLHPPEMVTAENWQQYSNGHVGDSVKRDGNFVNAELTISKKSLVEKIDRKEGKELSCGYTCDLEMRPGTFNGEKYDAIQRNIQYNHVAVGPENWGRAGSEVSMRLDGKEVPLHLDSDDAICRFDVEATDTQSTQTKEQGERPVMAEVRIDGITYDAGSTGHIQAIEKMRDDAVSRADTADQKVEEVTAEFEKNKGELESTGKRADEAEASLKEYDDPKKLDTLVNNRTALLESARKLDSDAEYEGLTETEIMVKALQKSDCEIPEGATVDYVAGVFASECRRADSKPSRKQSSTAELNRAGPKKVQKKDDDEGERLDARQQHILESKNAYKKPLAYTKQREA